MINRLLCLALLLATSAITSGEGKQVVTTSGQPVQLVTASTPITVCTITALSTNKGTIWLGFDSNVSAANKNGVPLAPPIVAGQPGGTYPCTYAGGPGFWRLEQFWIDATVSGEGVSFGYK